MQALGVNEAGRLEWADVVAVRRTAPIPMTTLSVGNWQATVGLRQMWHSERRTAAPVPHLSACPECGATEGRRGPFPSTRAVQGHLARVHGRKRAPQGYCRVAEPIATDAITTAHRLAVAGLPLDQPGTADVTPAEAELLGWIAGDGHINFASRTVNVWLYQSKTRFLPVIDALLSGIPHSRYVRDRNPGRHLPSVAWRLSAPYARGLIARSGYLDGSPTSFVLGLSGEGIRRWLDGVLGAEGWTVPSGGNGATLPRVSQNVGPWADAMTLAAYLAGYRPTRHLKTRASARHSPNWNITLGRPWVGGTHIRRTPAGDQESWNVTTRLGTWTMLQDGLPMLTAG